MQGRIKTMNVMIRLGKAVLRSIAPLFVLCVLVLMLTTPASADSFIYTYQGNPLTDPQNGYACSPGPCDISGSFTVSSQLFADLTNGTATPTAWSFNDDNGLSLGSCLGLCSGITVTDIDTDAAGNITSWDVELIGCFAHCTMQTESVTGTSTDISTPNNFIPVESDSNTGTPGTWTCEDITSGPNGHAIPCGAAAPAPEPSSLGLLVPGLFALAGALVRKRRAV